MHRRGPGRSGGRAEGFGLIRTVRRAASIGMATCIFVASGLEFAVDDYLRRSPFKAMTVFRKGTVPQKDNPQGIPRPDSGFCVLVGSETAGGIRTQLRNALQFLIRHDTELRRIRKVGVDNMLFDFGVARSHDLQEAEYFPPELIQAMAQLGMGMITSTVLLPQG